jgi:hypothetical protein
MKYYAVLFVALLCLASCSVDNPVEQTEELPVGAVVGIDQLTDANFNAEGKAIVRVGPEIIERMKRATTCGGFDINWFDPNTLLYEAVNAKDGYYLKVPLRAKGGSTQFYMLVQSTSNPGLAVSSDATCISCTRTCCVLHYAYGSFWCDTCNSCSVEAWRCD